MSRYGHFPNRDRVLSPCLLGIWGRDLGRNVVGRGRAGNRASHGTVPMRTAMRTLGLALVLPILVGCADMFDGRPGAGRTIALDEAHYCAVGHDLARQIAETVSVRGLVLVSRKRQTRCERYALHYLRRAGFAIDESGRSPTFDITLAHAGESEFQATASIGRTLRISRIYVPGDGGVYPVSPVSVMRLSPRTVWRAPAELIRNEDGGRAHLGGFARAARGEFREPGS